MKAVTNPGENLSSNAAVGAAPTVLVWLGCCVAILMALERGYEGAWYRLGTIIHHPEAAAAPFGYRPLLPLAAGGLQWLFHGMNDHNAFIATQVASIAATVYLMGKWTSLYLPVFGRLPGFMLAALLLCPTIGYWTFYDIALTGFWTTCLLLLYYEKRVGYVLVFTLATFNHENILLLVPCAVLYCRGRMKWWKLMLFTLAQIAAWCGVRYVVVASVHAAPALFENHLQMNLHFWQSYTKQALFFTGVTLLPWWGLAAMGWKHATRLLRCAVITLPGLVLVTILFGRFDEPRQFDGFIPVCAGLIACWAASAIYPAAAEGEMGAITEKRAVVATGIDASPYR
jgi:hypothetical protein